MRPPRLLVAGAGPVGAIAALAAARAGFDVQLIDGASGIAPHPRAATTHPSTLEMIARLGLLERFIAEGLVAREFQFWDRSQQALIATFDHQRLEADTAFPFVVQTEQHKLVRMALDALQTHGAEARFDTRVLSCRQIADHVEVEVETDGVTETVTADWLIAADGGRSTIRKQLGIPFEGYTWQERFLVLTVLDDFEAMMNCCYRNYFADRVEWLNLFKVSGDDGAGRWRVVSPVNDDVSDEEALGDAEGIRRLTGVCSTGKAYQIVHRNLYRVHQRVAATFRKGRILLAGDAGHVNNPIGGLGLNFGIHDAIDAVDTLSAHVFGGQDEDTLDGYSRRRRNLNIKFVQEQTIANKRRLEEKDEGARKAALDNLRATAEDPVRSRAFLLRSSLIESVREAAMIS